MKGDKRKRIFENIYDLIKGGDFELVAKNQLRAYIKYKNIDWDGDNNIISLGKHFKIKLIDN